jgi:hypothetical protein
VKTQWVRTVAVGLCGSLMLLAGACRAQKPNDWPMQNAMIGPDSPIEVRAGGAYTAQALYPVPDGPLFPLKAKVTWSIAPEIKGISIDPESGRISVDAGVPHGATTTVHANLDHGRRKLEARLFVFRPEENPLIGKWSIDRQVACGGTEEMKVPVPRLMSYAGLEWDFHVDRQFWIGRTMSIAAGISLSGSYEFDRKKHTLELLPQWPRNKPASSWNFSLVDEGKKLLLRPLHPEYGSESGCSYVLHQR